MFPGGDVVGESQVEVLGKLGDRQVTGKCAHDRTCSARNSAVRSLNASAVMVDGSVEGFLKPDPRLYELMAERLGVGFADMVFVDDQPTNVRGAEALGIPTVPFDPQHPDTAYAQLRRLLALAPAE